MVNFDSLKVGDVTTMVTKYKGKKYFHEAKVVEVDAQVIKCSVIVDQPRIFIFDKKTGIEVLGKEYGWLNLD